MTLRKTFLLVSLFVSANIYSQDFFTRFLSYMEPRLPEGWSMGQQRDSIFAFNKLVHWQEMLDPPPDSYGYHDTMTMFIHFHPFQNDSEQVANNKLIEGFKWKMDKLKQQRNDSIYRGKKGFYKWWGELSMLQSMKQRFEYVYFKNCSISYSYWDLYDGLKYYDEQVDKEVELIKQTLVDYLKN